MPETPVLLVGLGFTGRRLANKLLQEGRQVFAATRSPERFAEMAKRGLVVGDFWAKWFPVNTTISHTIPPLEEPQQSALHDFLLAVRPRRIVYVSATSVYGDLATVNEASAVVPSTSAGIRRFSEEEWIQKGPWNSLILRAAAIYGPGRGAHRRVLHPETPRDTQKRGPSGMVSRIHVDDLASLVRAGIDSDLTGAYPVADDMSCSTEEIMRWSAAYLGLDAGKIDFSGPVTTGRDVDGRAVRERLGVRLAYPDYRAGIANCLREEGEFVPPV